MCECSNSLQLHCLCRANWFDHNDNQAAPYESQPIYRTTYQTGQSGEVARTTHGRWQSAGLRSLGFADDTVNLICNGDIIFASGANVGGSSAGYRFAAFDWATAETLWNKVVTGFTPDPSGSFDGDDRRARWTGPWGVEFTSQDEVAAIANQWLITSATQRYRLTPAGLHTLRSGVPSGFTDYSIATHHNGDPRVFLRGGNYGTGNGTGFIGSMNDVGVVSARQSVFSTSVPGAGGIAASYDGQDFYAAFWRDVSGGGELTYKHHLPWGDKQLSTPNVINYPFLLHECWGGGLAGVFSTGTFTYRDTNGTDRASATLSLGYIDAANQWERPLWTATSTNVFGALPNWVFADELSLWVNFAQGSLISLPFPEFFPQGTRTASPFNTLRIAKDLSAIDMVGPQTRDTHRSWPLQRLDCISKATPTQHKPPFVA